MKDEKKSLAKLEEEEKISGDLQSGKKAELKKLIAENEQKIEDLATESTKVVAEPSNEKSDKLKDLQKSLKDIE